MSPAMNPAVAILRQTLQNRARTPFAYGVKGGEMGFVFRRLQWGYVCVLIFFIVGCSWMQSQKKPETEKEFLRETRRLETLAHGHPDSSVRARSHLKLAFLYANCRNPQLNYTRALQEMESYLSLEPAKKQEEDFNNWLAVLKEIGKLQRANRSLREEVAGLKETMDKLKNLDREMEQKRMLTK